MTYPAAVKVRSHRARDHSKAHGDNSAGDSMASNGVAAAHHGEDKDADQSQPSERNCERAKDRVDRARVQRHNSNGKWKFLLIRENYSQEESAHMFINL